MCIENYQDFLAALRLTGFSMGGGNPKGIFSLLSTFSEGKEPEGSAVKWHTEDPDTDPWEWRMRVLEEERDIAYGKLFFGTSGYITKDWYPLFLAVRRKGERFDEKYESGIVSQMEKRIYDVISEEGQVSLHELKRLCGVIKTENSKFDRALTKLQMGMFISMCGRVRKLNKYGLEYGWNSTVFCTVERFWEERGVILPEEEPEKAYEKLRQQVLLLNPGAEEKTVHKFIFGV